MTKTEHVRINYRLTFRSAFHFGTGLRAGIIHRVVARDADDFLYVPGSTVKGVLRERCEQLGRLFKLKTYEPHTEDSALRQANADVTIIDRIFGSHFHPAHLYFDDLALSEEDRALFKPTGARTDDSVKHREFRARQTENRTQVTLSRVTNTAERQRLFTSEYGIRSLSFTGQIVGVLAGFPLPSGGPGTYSLLLLVAALASLDGDRIGGNKSTGAGKVDCEVENFEIEGESHTVTALLQQLDDLELYQIARLEDE
jgi:CRISPR/Cas system CSM-associated protein Csm3 (group 7 of RAMP superfamily)